MRIVRLSPYTGKLNVRYINITEEQLEAYRAGALAQNAFPNISASDREFIMTGLTDSDWDNVMVGNPPPPRVNRPAQVVVHYDEATRTYLLQTGNTVSEELRGSLHEAATAGREKLAELRLKNINASLSVYINGAAA